MNTSLVGDRGLGTDPDVDGTGCEPEGPATGEMGLTGRSSYTAVASWDSRPIMGDRCRRPGRVMQREGLYLLARPPYVVLQ